MKARTGQVMLLDVLVIVAAFVGCRSMPYMVGLKRVPLEQAAPLVSQAGINDAHLDRLDVGRGRERRRVYARDARRRGSGRQFMRRCRRFIESGRNKDHRAPGLVMSQKLGFADHPQQFGAARNCRRLCIKSADNGLRTRVRPLEGGGPDDRLRSIA